MGDSYPADERVLLIGGITGLFHTPEIIEARTSSTGKSVMVERESHRKPRRLDAETIFSGDSEYRDSRYYELYTPERLQKRQRSNKQPGPRAGTDKVSDTSTLPEPTHTVSEE